jgi:hypothetical protein
MGSRRGIAAVRGGRGVLVGSFGSVVATVWALAGVVQADQVHLVGGTQLEGKATRHGDKIEVETESGRITLSANDVDHIERGSSTVQRYEALEQQVHPGDVKGLLHLADFCRDHEMKAREQEVLARVIEIDHDQAEARARLGYVRTDQGWITQDEQMRAQGYVRVDGQWVTKERALELARLQSEANAAARQQEQAEASLAAQQAEMRARAAEDEPQYLPDDEAYSPVYLRWGYGYGRGYGYGYGARGRRGSGGATGTSHFPSVGARTSPGPGARGSHHR